MIQKLLFIGLLVTALLGCSPSTPATKNRSLNVSANVQFVQPWQHQRPGTVEVNFRSTHPFEPKGFSLGYADFPQDFRPVLRLTYLHHQEELGQGRDITLDADC